MAKVKTRLILSWLVVFSAASALPAEAVCQFPNRILKRLFPYKEAPLPETSAELIPWTKDFDSSLSEHQYYAIDLKNRIYLSKEKLPTDADPLIVRSKEGPKIIIQSGAVAKDSATGRLVKPRLVSENLSQRVLDCRQLTRPTGKTLFASYLKANLATTSVGLAVSEVTGSGRVFTQNGYNPDGARMVGSELGFTLFSTAVGGGIAQVLGNRNASLPLALATRATLALGMNRVNSFENSKILKSDAKNRSERIEKFNDIQSLIRVPLNQSFDQFLLKKLPNIAESACLSGSPITILLTPTTFRIFERFASSAIYYKARKEVINE